MATLAPSRIRIWWRTLSTTEKTGIAIPLICAIAAGVFGTIHLIIPHIFSNNDAEPTFVDVGMRGEKNGPTVADIKIRNKGKEVAFIKGAEIEILDSRYLDYCPQASPVPASFTYEIELPAPPTKYPHVSSIPLSQEVKSGQTDRFEIKLGTGTAGIPGGVLYHFKVRLKYNEGERTHIESEPQIAYVNYPTIIAGSTPLGLGDKSFRECNKRNIESVWHMLDKKGRQSPYATELFFAMTKRAAQIREWEQGASSGERGP
ncbi:hypothetical protein [Streptomyces sp. NPDC041003]|uniref:hypothetical protein n=1 Tax=Streptomyces sp. NPDC041003 TaxID=3155730 RepID=UPI0033D7CEFC